MFVLNNEREFGRIFAWGAGVPDDAGDRNEVVVDNSVPVNVPGVMAGTLQHVDAVGIDCPVTRGQSLTRRKLPARKQASPLVKRKCK